MSTGLLFLGYDKAKVCVDKILIVACCAFPFKKLRRWLSVESSFFTRVLRSAISRNLILSILF